MTQCTHSYPTHNPKIPATQLVSYATSASADVDHILPAVVTINSVDCGLASPGSYSAQCTMISPSISSSSSAVCSFHLVFIAFFYCRKSQKKVSAINFSGDGRFVFFGNKFGDVLVAPTTPQTTQETRNTATGASSADSAPAEIFLGHYCSILTSLSISHHGKYIATTDRDAKTRVSIMPDDPLNGALDIQTFCFGHSMFVTCSAFINYHSASCGGNEKELLLTGSGDGTLRLWDFMTGRLLCTLLIGLTVEQDRLLREQQGGQLQLEPDPQEQQQQQQQDDDDNDGDGDDDGHGADTTTNGEAKEGTAAIKPTPVLTIQPTPDGAHVLVTLDGDPAVRLVSINFEEETMTLHEQMLSLPSLPIISDMCLDPSSNLFWMIGGPVASNESNDVVLACVSLETAASRLNVVEYSNSPIPSLGREEISNAMGMLCHGESKDGTAVVPRKYIPSYLNKRMFNSRRFEGKKSEKEA